MNIGYACLALGVPGTGLQKCLLRNATEQRLRELIAANLDALERMVDYNSKNGIRLYRISSDIIPFASSPVMTVPWITDYARRLSGIGQKIRDAGMRVSMHPGQYTVLNSPVETIAANAALELAYHASLLDALGVDARHKIILHVGGAYGDKPAATARFRERYARLPQVVRARLVLENDDRIFTVADVLSIAHSEGIPVVYDNLHNAANPSPEGGDDATWIRRCAATWRAEDGPQKIHYSQPAPGQKIGAHSQSISVEAFLRFVEGLPSPQPDLMLEVKDKNVSALKCILCTRETAGIAALEREWGRYKYRVLEHSQRHYREIRALLKDKAAYPAVAFYRLVEAALTRPAAVGDAVNAAQHVWGYFKRSATPAEQRTFTDALKGYRTGRVPLARLKRALYRMAVAYREEYLLTSYYFLEDAANGGLPG